VELRLFQVVGGWVPETTSPEVVAHLAAASRRHAAHAELWLGHVPVVAGRDPDDLVVAPTAGAAAALEALAEPAGSDGVPRDGDDLTVARLTGLYRVVVPRLQDSYAATLEVVSPIADPALRRSLRAVVDESAEDAATGARLLQGLLVAPGDRTATAALAEQRIDALIDDGGGLTI
jgi:hypothetical protein